VELEFLVERGLGFGVLCLVGDRVQELVLRAGYVERLRWLYVRESVEAEELVEIQVWCGEFSLRLAD
jgi:hypothetical protein